MHINEDYIEDIELNQEEVSASEEGSEYPYVLKMKTAVIPKGRGLGFYYDNIVKMNKVIDRALAGFPLIESYDHDYEIKRLSEGKMGWGDEEQFLSDGHRFFDDPDRINKHGRSMEYVIRINVRLETLSQIRQFLVFMWNVLLKAIDVSFKAQTSAQQVALEKDDSYILITSRMANVWIERRKVGISMFMDAVRFIHPDMKTSEISQIVKDFLEKGSSESGTISNSAQNLVKKKVMAELDKCGLKSVIKDVRQEGNDIIVETDSKMKLKGYQIQQLAGKKIFRNVEELVISDADEGQIDKADELATHGWFPNLNKVTIRINTDRYWKWNEMLQAVAKPDKPLKIDLLGYFSKYKLDVKVKTDDYALYGSEIQPFCKMMKLEVITDSGTKNYEFTAYKTQFENY